jgi:hypothetical protein
MNEKNRWNNKTVGRRATRAQVDDAASEEAPKCVITPHERSKDENRNVCLGFGSTLEWPNPVQRIAYRIA